MSGETGVGAPGTFGRLLRAHRHRLGLSLAQLAARLHYDRGHISKVENDKRSPSMRFAQACDRVLDTGATFASIAAALESAAERRQGWVRPAQLPAVRRDFVGRGHLLTQLDTLLLGGGRSLAVPVVVIEGPPGVGKTELAVRWARRSVDGGHFADGQLFVDLRGSDPRAEVPPTGPLGDVLVALGVPGTRIPASLEQRAAAFRSILHDRKMLLVLDDAAHARQIHSLLPGSPGCAVVVTSHVRLPGLTSRLGAVTLTVPELTAGEAVELVRSIIGDRCADADPRAIPAIGELCGHLPLTLVLAAEHIVGHGQRGAGPLAAVLETVRARSDLGADDVGVRDPLDSYELLDATAAHLLWLLSRRPSPVFRAETAAAVAGISHEETARLLRRLADAHMIQHHEERPLLPGVRPVLSTATALENSQ